MSGDGGALEGLQDVDHNLLHRLKEVGITSISDLATTTASELLEDYYSNYDVAVKGIDFETISQLVLKAKCKLIEDGLLQEDFSSAEKILERRQEMAKFSTGSDSFVSFLGGGIETQALTEIVGEFGFSRPRSVSPPNHFRHPIFL